MMQDSSSQGREFMTNQEIDQWLAFINTRSIAYANKPELTDDYKCFVKLYDEIVHYEYRKRMNDGRCEPAYWRKLIELDSLYISLERRYIGL